MRKPSKAQLWFLGCLPQHYGDKMTVGRWRRTSLACQRRGWAEYRGVAGRQILWLTEAGRAVIEANRPSNGA